MKNTYANITRLSAGLVYAFLAVNLVLLAWYLFIGYQAGFHSDSAAKVLIAREIVATGSYFPKDWNYVNNDLLVLFGHAFIIPLLAFLPAGYLVHAISDLVSSILVLISVGLITTLIPLSLIQRVMILAVMSAGISGFLAENIYGQASYGTIIYIELFILYFCWRFIANKDDNRLIWSILLFLSVVLVFWSNPQRALVSYGFPLLSAIVLLPFARGASVNSEDKRNLLIIFVIVGVGAILGSFVHIKTISEVNNNLGAGHARWLDFDNMVRNAKLFFKGYIAIFGGLPKANTEVVSGAGLYQAIRLAMALGLLALMPYCVVRTLRKAEPAFVFLCIFSLTAFALVFFFQVTTTIPDMTDPVQSSRYFVPSLILLLMVVLMQPLDFKTAPILGAVIVFVATVVMTGAYPAYAMSDANSNMTWGMPGQLKVANRELPSFLRKNGLRYGYATYWNAGVQSVLSDEEVLVRQVVLNGGIPMPMRHLSSNRWYRPEAWKGETFLLLTEIEARQIDLNKLSSFQLDPVRELSYKDFRIYVFNENMANRLPGWDRRYENGLIFPVSKYSASQAGRLVENYEGKGKSALVAEKGVTGALHFGPYIEMEPGRYVVTFDVLSDYHPNGAVKLDVAAAPDQKVFGESLLQASDKPQEIIISLDKTRTMEFRVWALGTERVVFRGFSIRRLPISG